MLDLNKNAIAQANACSQYDAGSALARESEAVYAEGVARMQPEEPINERQQAILAARLAEWKTLVEEAYNDIIARRGAWMPWTVCGPARYNSAKNNAKADRQHEAAAEWNRKMEAFVANTRSMLRDAVPLEQILSEYRSGKRTDAISADDPHAAEKLAARIEGLRETQETMKARNAHYRKHGTMQGFPGMSDEQAAKIDESMKDPSMQGIRNPYLPWILQENLANIKRLEQRLQQIESRRAAGDAEHAYNGFAVRRIAEEGRINILFDDKPEDAAREILKRNGFHWSPREKVWTRKLTPNAVYSVEKLVVPALLKLDAYAPQEAPAMSLEQFAEAHA